MPRMRTSERSPKPHPKGSLSRCIRLPYTPVVHTYTPPVSRFVIRDEGSHSEGISFRLEPRRKEGARPEAGARAMAAGARTSDSTRCEAGGG